MNHLTLTPEEAAEAQRVGRHCAALSSAETRRLVERAVRALPPTAPDRDWQTRAEAFRSRARAARTARRADWARTAEATS